MVLNNEVNEPVHEWGGQWTERKLDSFAKYVSAYLRIMKKKSYWKTIYFDGFAGSGSRKIKCNSDLIKNLFDNDPEKDNYKGAAERVLNLPDDLKFDFHYFIDSEEKSLEKLRNKISIYQSKHKNPFQYKVGDCNKHLLQFSNYIRSQKMAALVLLDPFGMQIRWDSISQLAKTKTDIWILVPTGIIVNRLLDIKGNLRHSVKLQSFFGINEDKIKEYFYKSETVNTLFGEQEFIHKVTKPIEKISELYIKQLNTIWSYVIKNLWF